ncbi:fructosamine kinase [Marinithermofilum abyssi]|uniref:Fructosamine kinase n=1 Tax=Marinithermofilum abyssi TaxID=1571185 RepID=A0A8J2VDU4_9BACL|nr:fructosamine kinase family protein [Marinithermofilum abyssi]GGE18712.1 fructosamine kinase [Marinithermofilum abyssi]
MLPDPIREDIQNTLKELAEDPGPIEGAKEIAGGDISHAVHLTTPLGSYFLKWREETPPGFFHAEAEGLKLLQATQELRVPLVLDQRSSDNGGPGWIIMEWIDPAEPDASKEDAGEALGRGLAEIHQQKAPSFGLEEDNYIGILPQPNGWMERWTDFYREQRLLPQVEAADKQDLLTPERAQLLNTLMDRLDHWLDDPSIQPSLLHGDLWGGNWMVGQKSTPWLIDPAVSFGHREMDIAMSELFGGFPPSFYESYQEMLPLDEGYKDRKPLYHLYYLLVHLNMFGESYGSHVDKICQRYVG